MRPLLLAALAVSLVGTASAQPDGVPLGLGIAQPTGLTADRPLYFFGSAEAAAPLDSLTVREGPHHFEIATAPPWLDPEVAQVEEATVWLRVVGVTRQRAEVIVHGREVRWPPRTMWVEREAVRFVPWAAFWLEVHSIETPEAAPLHLAPDGETVGMTEAGRPLHVLEVRRRWARVAWAEAPEAEAGPLGWVRWHDGERLLVRYSLRS